MVQRYTARDVAEIVLCIGRSALRLCPWCQFSLLICVIWAPLAHAEPETDFFGHLKYQPTLRMYREDSVLAELGPDTVHEQDVDLRLAAAVRQSRWDLDLQTELLGTGGNGLSARRILVSSNPLRTSDSLLISDERRALDLTTELLDGEDAAAVGRVDRLSLGYVRDSYSIRLGRQAVSWGNGLVFSVLDVFNPFSPVEIDKDYKTGDDMLYGQWVLGMQGDLQFVAIPRRRVDGPLAAHESSFAVKLRYRLEPIALDVDLVAARHYGEPLFGAGFSRGALGAVLRGDISVVELQDGARIVTAAVNVDRSWVLLDTNVYGYLEYFRSGLGAGDGNYTSLDDDLIERLDRGELFVIGRDYFASGVRVEMSPLVQWFSAAILNLHDESGIVQQRFEFDAAQNCLIVWGANIPFGVRGSEFGGIALPPVGAGAAGSEPDALFLSSGLGIYGRFSYYF